MVYNRVILFLVQKIPLNGSILSDNLTNFKVMKKEKIDE